MKKKKRQKISILCPLDKVPVILGEFCPKCNCKVDLRLLKAGMIVWVRED